MKAFAIKDPKGKIVRISIEGKKILTGSFGWHDWNYYYRLGYRCVPVEITEITKEKV